MLMDDELDKQILRAHKRSFQRAFETAVRTGTSLIFSRNGKIVEVKPPTGTNWFLSSLQKKGRRKHPLKNKL
jgi:hypothetical protein